MGDDGATSRRRRVTGKIAVGRNEGAGRKSAGMRRPVGQPKAADRIADTTAMAASRRVDGDEGRVDIGGHDPRLAERPTNRRHTSQDISLSSIADLQTISTIERHDSSRRV